VIAVDGVQGRLGHGGLMEGVGRGKGNIAVEGVGPVGQGPRPPLKVRHIRQRRLQVFKSGDAAGDNRAFAETIVFAADFVRLKHDR